MRSEKICFVQIGIILACLCWADLSQAQGNIQGNNRIQGFRYTSCDRSFCLMVEAQGAWISIMGNGAFSTDGATTVSIRNPDGSLRTVMEGTDASFNSRIGTLSLELHDRSVAFISLQDGSVEILGLSAGSSPDSAMVDTRSRHATGVRKKNLTSAAGESLL